MPALNIELDLELNSDVDKDTAFNYTVRLLRNLTHYIENHPAAYNEVLAVFQEIPQPKPLPTPASTPREELDIDSQADQHKNNLVDPHDHSSLAVKQELSRGDRPLCHAYVEDADDSSVEQTGDNSQRSVNLDVWPPSGHHDTYDQETCQEKQSSERTVTSSTPQRLDTPQYPSSKRKQHFEDGVVASGITMRGITMRGIPFTREQLLSATASSGPSTKGHDQDLCKLMECLLRPDSFGRFLEQHKVGPKAVLSCVETWCKARLAGPAKEELAEREGTA